MRDLMNAERRQTEMTKHYWCEECQNFVDEHVVTNGIHDECGQEVNIEENE